MCHTLTSTKRLKCQGPKKPGMNLTQYQTFLQALLFPPLPPNFSSLGTGLLFPFAASDPHVTQSFFSMFSFSSCMLFWPLLLSWSVTPLSVQLIPSFSHHPPWPGLVHWSSLVSTLPGVSGCSLLHIYNKTSSTTIPRSDHLFIFIHYVHSYLTFFLRMSKSKELWFSPVP